MPLVADPEPLAYALPGAGQTLADLRPALRWMLWTAIFSGLCVGSCFLCFKMHAAVYMLHMLIYAATLYFGVRAGTAAARAGWRDPVRATLDALAAVALTVIGVVPLVVWDDPHSPLIRECGLAAGAAFFVLAVTSLRHRRLYGNLAALLRADGRRGAARAAVSLGNIKWVFETVWLLCCALPLLAISHHLRPIFSHAWPGLSGDYLIWIAVAAFCGCIVYGAIWVWMIALHARLVVVAARERTPGFDVLPLED